MTLVKRRMKLETRATPDAGAGSFEAVVSAYNSEYDIGWGWTEMILPGAFGASIAAHPVIPIFYEHDWDAGPIGVGNPIEDSDRLRVQGHLYLDQGDSYVNRIYQAMVDQALQEWSIAFWVEELTWTDENPTCDQIVSGDLAEATVCVRGANPDTKTIDLRDRPLVQLMGDEDTRKGELVRIRHKLGVPDAKGPARRSPRTPPAKRDAPPRRRDVAAGNDEEPLGAGQLAQSVDAVLDEVVDALEAGDVDGAMDLVVAAGSTVDDLLEVLGVEDNDGLESDSAPSPEDRAARQRKIASLMSTASGRETLRAMRSSNTSPSAT